MIKKCIFCGRDSSNSKSVEHIIPESLGNDQYILEKGFVCDSCNNYFAHHIESKVLNLGPIKQLRLLTLTENKKGKIPKGICSIGKEEYEIQYINGNIFIGVPPESISRILMSKADHIYVGDANVCDLVLLRNNYDVARLLAKITFEFLVSMFLEKCGIQDDTEEVIIQEEWMKKIRDYAKIGNKERTVWPYTVKFSSDCNSISFHFTDFEGKPCSCFKYLNYEFYFYLEDTL